MVSLIFIDVSNSLKVGRPNLVLYLNRKPIFEWCVGSCGSKNGHQKDIMCL